MSRKLKEYPTSPLSLIEIKSKFDAEFRRFSLDRSKPGSFAEFQSRLECLHLFSGIPFVILYTDKEGDLLPINNNDNFLKALTSSGPILKIIIQRKDENWSDLIGYSTLNRKREAGVGKILGLSQLPISNHSASKQKSSTLKIGLPEDFRQVSAIIDVDILPQTHRRVRLLKHGSDKPLGFFIRDGVSIQSTPFGLERVPGVFISRIVPGGLAESTGLLSVNDEVVEVNGIEVAGKTLDQVTDMMVANCTNLIITVKPANQRYQSPPASDTQKSTSSRNNPQRASQISTSAISTSSFPSNHSYNTDDDELDEIRDISGGDLVRNANGNASGSSGTSSSSTAPPRDSGHFGKKASSNGQHVTKIILDGKHDGIIHQAEQVFTL